MSVDKATIVANINGEKGDKCYISAGRSGNDDKGERGMLFYKCHIRLANSNELQITNSQELTDNSQVWLARPWRWWGETVWSYTTWDEGILNPEAWNTGLTKGKECPNSYEYRSQDNSIGRPAWVSILDKPRLPDSTRLTPKAWLKK